MNSADDDDQVAKVAKKIEAEAILQATLRDKNDVQVQFYQIFEKSLPDLKSYNIVRNAKEEVAIIGYFERSLLIVIQSI